MLTEHITSRQNPLVKRAQRIRTGDEAGQMFVEGSRLVDEAVTSGAAIEALVYTAEFAATERGTALLCRFARSQCRGALVPDHIMRTICDVETPQGVVALAAQPVFQVEDVFEGRSPVVVVLDAVQDPGNVGTIIRAAEAAGASGVAATPGTAEPYAPKTLRASMGSAFRFPVVRRADIVKVAAAARERDMQVLASTARGDTLYTEVDWRRPSLLLVGNEGAGLSPAALALAATTVSIPLAEPVESLNAAVATAVLLFEAARQRRV